MSFSVNFDWLIWEVFWSGFQNLGLEEFIKEDLFLFHGNVFCVFLYFIYTDYLLFFINLLARRTHRHTNDFNPVFTSHSQSDLGDLISYWMWTWAQGNNTSKESTDIPHSPLNEPPLNNLRLGAWKWAHSLPGLNIQILGIIHFSAAQKQRQRLKCEHDNETRKSFLEKMLRRASPTAGHMAEVTGIWSCDLRQGARWDDLNTAFGGGHMTTHTCLQTCGQQW